MSVKINVTDEDIIYAERILLPAGRTFRDERNERINFIKNFETIDLHAVPGSGKTTALLAKLLILEKNLPFEDGSGVLVLSHTNTAVDEITKRIGPYCPKLFSYPNFVGTIQSFVDQYLAIPYFKQVFGKNIARIDNAIYNENIEKLSKKCRKGFDFKENNNAKSYLYANDVVTKYRFGDGDKLLSSINGKELEIRKPKSNHDWSEREKCRIKQWLIKLKKEVMENGILCFDDAYYLANKYLKEYPEIKKILQKRFSYVFVDEMQDMDIHQYQLLEDIFYDDGNSRSIYQRIGDRNQAIYGGGFDFSIDNIWKPRMEELEISGTYRLSDNIAEVVENFALDGRKMNSICQDKVNIKPHIIIYNDKNCSCKVIQKFAEIIRKNQRDHKIPAELKYPVKVVSWVVKKSEEGKITLPDYCPKFNREKSSSKIDFDSLESYLLNCGNIYRDIYNSIINACLKVLRLEEIKYEDKFYTKSSLMKYLRDEKPEEYEIFLQNLYHWSTLVIKKEQSKALSLIRDYIGCFLSLFSKSIKESYNFINDEAKAVEECNETDDYDCDSCKINGEKIEINSVHSVKGETHTATLYLESFYNKKYELDFISDMVLKKKVADKIKEIEMEIDRLKKELETLNGGRGSKTKEEGIKNKRKYIGNIKRYSKIVYVGFSRPTHLLAFAVHKDRYDKYLGKDIDRDFWEVVNVDDNSDVI